MEGIPNSESTGFHTPLVGNRDHSERTLDSNGIKIRQNGSFKDLPLFSEARMLGLNFMQLEKEYISRDYYIRTFFGSYVYGEDERPGLGELLWKYHGEDFETIFHDTCQQYLASVIERTKRLIINRERSDDRRIWEMKMSSHRVWCAAQRLFERSRCSNRCCSPGSSVYSPALPMSAPAPDLDLAFPIIQEKAACNSFESPELDDKSLADAHDKALMLGRKFCAVAAANSDANSFSWENLKKVTQGIDLDCFPWLVATCKPRSYCNEEAAREIARDASACLEMMAHLDQYPNREHKMCPMPVIALTFVGPTATVYIAYMHLKDLGPTEYIIQQVWAGTMTDEKSRAVFQSILLGGYRWAVLHLRPWILEQIQKWVQRNEPTYERHGCKGGRWETVQPASGELPKQYAIRDLEATTIGVPTKGKTDLCVEHKTFSEDLMNQGDQPAKEVINAMHNSGHTVEDTKQMTKELERKHHELAAFQEDLHSAIMQDHLSEIKALKELLQNVTSLCELPQAIRQMQRIDQEISRTEGLLAERLLHDELRQPKGSRHFIFDEFHDFRFSRLHELNAFIETHRTNRPTSEKHCSQLNMHTTAPRLSLKKRNHEEKSTGGPQQPSHSQDVFESTLDASHVNGRWSETKVSWRNCVLIPASTSAQQFSRPKGDPKTVAQSETLKYSRKSASNTPQRSGKDSAMPTAKMDAAAVDMNSK